MNLDLISIMDVIDVDSDDSDSDYIFIEESDGSSTNSDILGRSFYLCYFQDLHISLFLPTILLYFGIWLFLQFIEVMFTSDKPGLSHDRRTSPRDSSES